MVSKEALDAGAALKAALDKFDATPCVMCSVPGCMDEEHRRLARTIRVTGKMLRDQSQERALAGKPVDPDTRRLLNEVKKYGTEGD